MIKLLEQSLQRLFDIQGREHFFSIKFVLNKLKKKRSGDLWPSLAGLTCIPLLPGSAGAKLLQALVATNSLRPPGAVPEEIFPAKCIRCGRCVEVCPYRSILMLDIRSGIHAGTPLIEVEKIPCYLCMKCVDVCPTVSLQRTRQEDTRMGLAVINRFDCAAWIGMTLCRTCYDKCPCAEKAIRLDQLRPVHQRLSCYHERWQKGN
jgi:ferredoxin-type protein NapG